MTTSIENKIKELEIKLTFLEDYVSKQNDTIFELTKELDNQKKIIKTIIENIRDSSSSDGSFPANEKPPHW